MSSHVILAVQVEPLLDARSTSLKKCNCCIYRKPFSHTVSACEFDCHKLTKSCLTFFNMLCAATPQTALGRHQTYNSLVKQELHPVLAMRSVNQCCLHDCSTCSFVISCSWLMRWSTDQLQTLLQQLLLLLNSTMLLLYHYPVLCWSGVK